jgi:hypothetical protein
MTQMDADRGRERGECCGNSVCANTRTHNSRNVIRRALIAPGKAPHQPPQKPIHPQHHHSHPARLAPGRPRCENRFGWYTTRAYSRNIPLSLHPHLICVHLRNLRATLSRAGGNTCTVN